MMTVLLKTVRYLAWKPQTVDNRKSADASALFCLIYLVNELCVLCVIKTEAFVVVSFEIWLTKKRVRQTEPDSALLSLQADHFLSTR